ncbi:MAG: protein Shroom2-like [Satyrvirus sp.]|uniref:Protein Shroom2-like n=1 Tax=Satyrvirus sp. TaxID=2487771 RepID=A0A3G5ADC3_9VIRU|nr:MAG: protein Shroom2-like [Satyrvirus sp.]
MFKLLIYNIGIDNWLKNTEECEQIKDDEHFYECINNQPKTNRNKQFFSCDPRDESIIKYNLILAKKFNDFVKNENISVVVLQEICTANINQLSLKNGIASYYNYPREQTYKHYTKCLLTGSYNEHIIISYPEEIYKMSTQNPCIEKYGGILYSKCFHDNFQVSKIKLDYNLYIINFHDRTYAGKEYIDFKFKLHLLCLIMIIISLDPNNIIILVGDANARDILFKIDESRLFVDENKKLIFEKNILYFKDFVTKFSQKYDDNNREAYFDETNRNIHILSLVNLVLKTVIEKYFNKCESENCNLKKYKICPQEKQLNTILYFKANTHVKINVKPLITETEKNDLCKWIIETSSHIPYIFEVNINKEDNAPDNIESLKDISYDKLLASSSNRITKIVPKKKGGNYFQKYQKYKTKYVSLKKIV